VAAGQQTDSDTRGGKHHGIRQEACAFRNQSEHGGEGADEDEQEQKTLF
jgi:hypothetical protein